MKPFSTAIFVISSLAMLSVAVQTATASTQSFNPDNDSMMFAAGSDLVDTGAAAGFGPGLFAGADGNSEIKRSVLHFDLSGFHSTATQVELDLWIGQIAGSGGGGGGGGGCGMGCTYPTRDFALYPITTGPWVEALAGNEACSGSPCGTMSGTGHGWSYSSCPDTSSGGCANSVAWLYYDWTGTTGVDEWTNEPNDQDYGYMSQGTAMATLTVSAPFADGDEESFIGSSGTNPDFLAEVNDWISNSGTNLGMELRSTNLEDEPTSFLGFWSKDGAAAASNGLAPVLTITY